MKNFRFDSEGFKTFYLIHAKHCRKNYEWHEKFAKLIMSKAFHAGLTPQYILDRKLTKSGFDEPFIQFAKDVKVSDKKVVTLNEYRTK